MNVSDVVMFLGITLICGSPLWMACYIIWDRTTDQWGKQCPHCHGMIYTDGCRCGRSKVRR